MTISFNVDGQGRKAKNIEPIDREELNKESSQYEMESTIYTDENDMSEMIRDFFILSVKILGWIILGIFTIGISVIHSHSIYPALLVIFGAIGYITLNYIKDRNVPSNKTKVDRGPLFYLFLLVFISLISYMGVKLLIENAINR